MTSHFLSLPRELRDNVYVHYVYEEGGYHYDAAASRMRTIDGRPLQLALQFTCRQVAAEMEGVAFRCNTITFTTLRDDTSKAGIVEDVLVVREWTLQSMLGLSAASITPEIMDELVRRHPTDFTIKLLRDMGPPWSQQLLIAMLSRQEDVAPSIARQRVHDIVEFLSSHSAFAPTFTIPIEHIVGWRPILWSILGDEKLFPLDQRLSAFAEEFPELQAARRHLFHFYFSAVTVAVGFLERLPKRFLRHLRHIVLYEDRRSIAYQECHAQALVTFCHENPRLRFERRADLMRTVFLKNPTYIRNVAIDGGGWLPELSVEQAVTETRKWIDEALIVQQQLGARQDAFSLVLEGPTRLKAQLWEQMKRAAAAQEAAQVLCQQGTLQRVSGIANGRPTLYMSEGFPQAIRDMIDCRSCVRLPVDKGAAWDVAQVIAGEKSLHAKSWQDFWQESLMDDSEVEGTYVGVIDEYMRL